MTCDVIIMLFCYTSLLASVKKSLNLNREWENVVMTRIVPMGGHVLELLEAVLGVNCRGIARPEKGMYFLHKYNILLFFICTTILCWTIKFNLQLLSVNA